MWKAAMSRDPDQINTKFFIWYSSKSLLVPAERPGTIVLDDKRWLHINLSWLLHIYSHVIISCKLNTKLQAFDMNNKVLLPHLPYDHGFLVDSFISLLLLFICWVWMLERLLAPFVQSLPSTSTTCASFRPPLQNP